MRRADLLKFVMFTVSVAVPLAWDHQATSQTATGTLRLTIDPPSLVLIDNEEIGEVAKRSIELTVGPHRVRIVHADFQPLRRTVDIGASELIELNIDLYDKGVPRNPGVIPSRPPGARPSAGRGDQKPPSQPAPIARPQPAPAAAPAPVAHTERPAQPAPETRVEAPAQVTPAQVTPQPAAVVPAPEPVPPPAPAVSAIALDAQLRVKIDPPAEVWIDGVRQGVYGEGTIAISAGRHDVRIVHDDYQPLNRRLTVTTEKPAVLDLKLADRAVPKPRPQP